MNNMRLGFVVLLAGAACITTYNRPKVTPKDGAPLLEERPAGCHVDVFEEGQKVTRPHLETGFIVLNWPKEKIKEQGPEGAMTTLKAAACEHGAFLIKDFRALSTGADGGLVYEGTLATLVENGRPINEKKEKEKDKPAETQAAAEPAPARGW
jgi:hypothetical protein